MPASPLLLKAAAAAPARLHPKPFFSPRAAAAARIPPPRAGVGSPRRRLPTTTATAATTSAGRGFPWTPATRAAPHSGGGEGMGSDGAEDRRRRRAVAPGVNGWAKDVPGVNGVVSKEDRPCPGLLTLPTMLTIGRVAAVPLLISTFYMEGPWAATATTGIFLAAAITDWLDGYIARKMQLGTAFGAFLDPVADKLMVAAALVLLCTKPLETSLLSDGPWLLTVPSIAIIGREITMSAVREWAASQNGKVLEAVAVNNLGKWKTATQMTALTFLLASRDPRVNEGGEGGGGMKTVECLRGRLLAERVASKAAKEEADQLSKRLDELELKLADEVKVRNKAERRLRKAIKRLESLKILDVELSDGSVGSLSSNGRSGHQAPELVEETNNLVSLSSTDSARDGASSAASCTLVNSSSQDGSSCSVVSEQSPAGFCTDLGDTNNNCNSGASAGDHDSDRQQLAAPHCPARSEQDSRDGDDDRLALVLVDPQLVAGADDSRTHGGSTAQTAEHHAGAHEENKLALVLLDPQPQPAAAPKPHSDVESVLRALRQVKEQLRYTIERRSELVAHLEVYGH